MGSIQHAIGWMPIRSKNALRQDCSEKVLPLRAGRFPGPSSGRPDELVPAYPSGQVDENKNAGLENAGCLLVVPRSERNE